MPGDVHNCVILVEEIIRVGYVHIFYKYLQFKHHRSPSKSIGIHFTMLANALKLLSRPNLASKWGIAFHVLKMKSGKYVRYAVVRCNAWRWRWHSFFGDATCHAEHMSLGIADHGLKDERMNPISCP